MAFKNRSPLPAFSRNALLMKLELPMAVRRACLPVCVVLVTAHATGIGPSLSLVGSMRDRLVRPSYGWAKLCAPVWAITSAMASPDMGLRVMERASGEKVITRKALVMGWPGL